MITIEEALKNGRGDWRSFTCPVHDDNSPSARVNVNTGKWVCMSCGAKGKSDEAMAALSVDDRITYIRKLLEGATVTTKSERQLDIYDIVGPGKYWLSRFSAEACEEFRLGMDGDYPVYPVRDEGGNLMGMVRRNPYDERPKYIYPKGIVTSNYLFGYEKADCYNQRLVLVEGAPDVIAAWEAGVTAVGSYGSHLSDRQALLIDRLGPSEVMVAYDTDRAGREGIRSAVRTLLGRGIPAFPIPDHPYHDVAEMAKNFRKRILSDPIDSKSTFEYLLSRA